MGTEEESIKMTEPGEREGKKRRSKMYIGKGEKISRY